MAAQKRPNPALAKQAWRPRKLAKIEGKALPDEDPLMLVNLRIKEVENKELENKELEKQIADLRKSINSSGIVFSKSISTTENEQKTRSHTDRFERSPRKIAMDLHAKPGGAATLARQIETAASREGSKLD